MDPTPEERQRAWAANGNTNVQNANQLGECNAVKLNQDYNRELIGHLFLKMSEHSNSATAHINTHADDITSLSHKLNKFVADADAQFQVLYLRIPAGAAAANPPPVAATVPPVQETRTLPSVPTPTRKRTKVGSAGSECSKMQQKWPNYQDTRGN